MSVNKAILVGRLGGDPVVKQVGDQPVANFSIATSESWKDKSGAKQERTEWHRICVWGKLAELAGQYLKKGRQVYIEGKIQTRMWEAEGKKNYMTEVIAHTIQFLGDAPQGAGAGAPPPAQPPEAGAPGYGQTFTQDDIPF